MDVLAMANNGLELVIEDISTSTVSVVCARQVKATTTNKLFESSH